MESSQHVVLPPDRYPITIITLRVGAGANVQKDDVLGIYEYLGTVMVKDRESQQERPVQKRVKEELRSQWTGRIDKVGVQPGQTVTDPREPLAIVVEPCGHLIQVRGICATCGKDLSIGDYMGNDMTRATINMAHDALGVTVSRDVAEKLDKDTSQRLLKERKLTLILDLDQTVVHATVDSTVREWKADPSNPNYPFLQDVHVFGIPHYQTHYVKLRINPSQKRPGTREFLADMNKNFEMHIYTMGSRAYANKIAEIIDPDRTLFKNRILSRDENLSRSFKSIQRLFPSDQSMVVVLDDRSDVWHWSPNLYKILPFTFFVGTGDINALPTDPPPTQQRKPSFNAGSLNSDPVEKSDEVEEVEESQEVLAQLEDAQHHALEELEKNRPLQKLSEETEKDEETEPMSIDESRADAEQATPTSVTQTPVDHQGQSPRTQRRRPVLSENDRELDRVKEVLLDVHKMFYDVQDKEHAVPDVRKIMSQAKSEVLQGVKVVFSLVFPTNVDPSTQDLWLGAEHFGAKCSLELTDDVTHVITVEQTDGSRSDKVKRARQMPGVFVVKPEWLVHSISRWERQREAGYLLEKVCRGPPPSIETAAVADLDEDDEAILSGRWEHENDIYLKLGHDDIEAMNREIEDALADDSTEEGDGEASQQSDFDLDAALDAEFDALLEEDNTQESSKKRTSDDAGLNR
ncbi:hypothetical protein SpCBS45565_g02023 [Spizellomyces sp. 'palustris']|nr:hypothetical protein SpCBS45565_g02023 [Spizellomyces sp. 'palustris']